MDPRSFAKSTKRSTGGRGCVTCANKKVSAWVHKVLEVWASGEGEPSAQPLHDHIVEHMGYDRSLQTFYNHLRGCESQLWRKIQGKA